MRIAVVGVGHLGRHHARILSALSGVELVGVADINAARAREIAASHDTHAFDDWRLLLDRVEIGRAHV